MRADAALRGERRASAVLLRLGSQPSAGPLSPGSARNRDGAAAGRQGPRPLQSPVNRSAHRLTGSAPAKRQLGHNVDRAVEHVRAGRAPASARARAPFAGALGPSDRERAGRAGARGLSPASFVGDLGNGMPHDRVSRLLLTSRASFRRSLVGPESLSRGRCVFGMSGVLGVIDHAGDRSGHGCSLPVALTETDVGPTQRSTCSAAGWPGESRRDRGRLLEPVAGGVRRAA